MGSLPGDTGPSFVGNPLSTFQQATKPIVNSLQILSDPVRLILLVLGVILIAAGLFSFKQTQVVIEKAGAAAAKAGALAA